MQRPGAVRGQTDRRRLLPEDGLGFRVLGFRVQGSGFRV